MGSALDKAKGLLKKAQDQQKAPGDNAEKVAVAAAEAIRAFVEVGKKEGAAEEKDVKEATNLLNEAFSKSTGKVSVALSRFVSKHFEDGMKEEARAKDNTKTPTNDAKTEAYTKAACEYHMAAVARAQSAKIEEDAADNNPSSTMLDYDAVGDSYRSAADQFVTAAEMYHKAADLESGDNDHEKAERKLGLIIAAGLATRAAEDYTKAASAHDRGRSPEKVKEDKENATKQTTAAGNDKKVADNIKLK